MLIAYVMHNLLHDHMGNTYTRIPIAYEIYIATYVSINIPHAYGWAKALYHCS